jgi:integrase
MIHAALNKMYGLFIQRYRSWGNLSLRIGDRLNLKYADLNLDKRTLELNEAKIGKFKLIRLNAPVIAIITRPRQEHPNDVGLFQVHSNFAKDKRVSRVFKAVGDLLGLTLYRLFAQESWDGLIWFRKLLLRVRCVT